MYSTTGLSLSSQSRKTKVSWPQLSSINQQYSIPHPVIYFVAQNISHPDIFLKLLQTCKNIFEINPVIVTARIHDSSSKLCSVAEIECDKNDGSCCVKVNIKKINTKIWVTDEMEISRGNINDTLLYLLPKIYRHDRATIYFGKEQISFDHFKILAVNFRNFHLLNTTIIDQDENNVMLETIFESIPNVKQFSYAFNEDVPSATKASIKNIHKLQNLNNLEILQLRRIPEIIDISDLTKFVVALKNTFVWLYFESGFSELYKHELDNFVDAVLNQPDVNISINYRGDDEKKAKILIHRLFENIHKNA